jgi:hypothetical protein
VSCATGFWPILVFPTHLRTPPIHRFWHDKLQTLITFTDPPLGHPQDFGYSHHLSLHSILYPNRRYLLSKFTICDFVTHSILISFWFVLTPTQAGTSDSTCEVAHLSTTGTPLLVKHVRHKELVRRTASQFCSPGCSPPMIIPEGWLLI